MTIDLAELEYKTTETGFCAIIYDGTNGEYHTIFYRLDLEKNNWMPYTLEELELDRFDLDESYCDLIATVDNIIDDENVVYDETGTSVGEELKHFHSSWGSSK